MKVKFLNFCSFVFAFAVGTGAITMGIKHLEYEAYHSPSTIAKVKQVWSCTSTPQCTSWHGA